MSSTNHSVTPLAAWALDGHGPFRCEIWVKGKRCEAEARYRVRWTQGRGRMGLERGTFSRRVCLEHAVCFAKKRRLAPPKGDGNASG